MKIKYKIKENSDILGKIDIWIKSAEYPFPFPILIADNNHRGGIINAGDIWFPEDSGDGNNHILLRISPLVLSLFYPQVELQKYANEPFINVPDNKLKEVLEELGFLIKEQEFGYRCEYDIPNRESLFMMLGMIRGKIMLYENKV